MEISYNQEGKWSVEAAKQRHIELRLRLGGMDGFVLEPRTYTNHRGITWIYNIMDSVADGVQLGDNACIEMAIDYIQADVMGSSTGYIRERMARALRHVQLTEQQKARLAEIFLRQMKQQCLHQEFREYIRLFKTIGVDPYRMRIEGYAKSHKQFIQRAARRLLTEPSV